MPYTYQHGLIDGQGVWYWHSQYIEQRNRVDELIRAIDRFMKHPVMRHLKILCPNLFRCLHKSTRKDE